MNNGYFPEVANLLNKRLAELSIESNNITKEINKHSDYKSNMNNYRVINAPLLQSLSTRLVAIAEEGEQINKVYRALVNGGAILTNADVSSIEYSLVLLFDRLPDHIQEEWQDNLQDIQKRLASGKGLR